MKMIRVYQHLDTCGRRHYLYINFIDDTIYVTTAMFLLDGIGMSKTDVILGTSPTLFTFLFMPKLFDRGLMSFPPLQ